MKTNFIILAIVLCLVSCKKNTSDSNTVNSGIVGNWRWIETVFGYAPSDSNPLTPKFAGYQESLTFNADHSFRLTKNNVIIDSGTYTYGSGTYSYSSDVNFMYDSILYYHKGILVKDSIGYYTISSDTLNFNPALVGLLGTGGVLWKRQ